MAGRDGAGESEWMGGVSSRSRCRRVAVNGDGHGGGGDDDKETCGQSREKAKSRAGAAVLGSHE